MGANQKACWPNDAKGQALRRNLDFCFNRKRRKKKTPGEKNFFKLSKAGWRKCSWADSVESMLAGSNRHTQRPQCVAARPAPPYTPTPPRRLWGRASSTHPHTSPTTSLFQLPRNTSRLSGLFCRLPILLKYPQKLLLWSYNFIPFIPIPIPVPQFLQL